MSLKINNISTTTSSTTLKTTCMRVTIYKSDATLSYILFKKQLDDVAAKKPAHTRTH